MISSYPKSDYYLSWVYSPGRYMMLINDRMGRVIWKSRQLVSQYGYTWFPVGWRF